MWNYPTISIKKRMALVMLYIAKRLVMKCLEPEALKRPSVTSRKRPPAKYPNVVTRRNAMLILLIYPKKYGEILICHEAMHSTIDC